MKEQTYLALQQIFHWPSTTSVNALNTWKASCKELETQRDCQEEGSAAVRKVMFLLLLMTVMRVTIYSVLYARAVLSIAQALSHKIVTITL